VRWRNVAAVAVMLLGSTQMVGYIMDSQMLRGIGAASGMAPLPKVFSDVDGMETFASEFSFWYTLRTGGRMELRITPDVYSRLAGPYNRRNVYGAALSYAPRLPQPLWMSVYCHGMGPDGPLRREIGVPDSARDVSMSIRTLTRGRDDRWNYAPDCTLLPR
jgi:hypothetical protein